MKKNRGFTLIELMVTVAIIGVLSAIVTSNFTQARAKSRDAKRISDIANIQLSLSIYFDRCGQYPNTALTTTVDEGCAAAGAPGITLGSFLSKIPTPPTPQPGGLTSYTYKTNYDSLVPGVPASDYVLGIQLEGNTDVLKDSIGATTYTVPCSVSTYYYCIGPK
ncbi:MAG: protein ral secretion pathway protein [Candidatus Parcubacteria bacterium]